jgi:hypothetical protein
MVNIDEQKQAIEKNRLAIEKHITELNDQSKKISTLIKVFIKKKNYETIVEAVSKDKENADRIGLDALKALKAKALNLSENNDEILEEQLSRSQTWLHKSLVEKNSEEFLKYCTNGFELARENINKSIQYCLGYAGEILKEYGFLNIPADRYFNFRHEGWCLDNGRVVYAFRYGQLLPGELSQAIGDYTSMISRFYMLVCEKEKLAKELKEKEMRDIWDQI